MAIDFEASALPCPGSYPIEVALADVADGVVKAWLIRPTAAWLRDGVWDPSAERLHGIDKERLLAEGLAPEVVLKQLREALAGARVVSDAVAADDGWLAELHRAGHIENDLRLEPLKDVLGEILCLRGRALEGAFEDAREGAYRRFPSVHRAAPDARRTAETIRIALGIEPGEAATLI